MIQVGLELHDEPLMHCVAVSMHSAYETLLPIWLELHKDSSCLACMQVAASMQAACDEIHRNELALPDRLTCMAGLQVAAEMQEVCDKDREEIEGMKAQCQQLKQQVQQITKERQDAVQRCAPIIFYTLNDGRTA